MWRAATDLTAGAAAAKSSQTVAYAGIDTDARSTSGRSTSSLSSVSPTNAAPTLVVHEHDSCTFVREGACIVACAGAEA